MAAFASNYKAGGKLGYQIAGGGQTASDNAGAVVNLGGVVPFLQLVVSVIAAIKHGYTMVRMHLRQHDLKKTLKKLYKSPTNDVKEVQAAEAVRETLSKRIVRIGLNLAHSVFAIAAGVLNMTGIGLVVGMIINIASAALKLGQIGVRKIKQTLRNKKAKHRAAVAESQKALGHDYEELTYKQWEEKRRLQAADTKGWGRFFKRARIHMDVAVTLNWDKSSKNKKKSTREVAIDLMRMNDTKVLKALGVSEALEAVKKQYENDLNSTDAEKDPYAAAPRLKIIIAALDKRD